MKRGILFVSATGLGLLNLGWGIEPPVDDVQPPAALLGGVGHESAGKSPGAVAENVAFLGLSTADIPEMVLSHLELEKGVGVIVRAVVPGSPAEKGGVEVNDIILAVNQGAVGGPEELSAAVQEHKPGDRLELSLVHHGKRAEVEITLGERPAGGGGGVQKDFMLQGLPSDHAERLQKLLEQGLSLGGGIGSGGPNGQMPEPLRLMQEQMKNLAEGQAEGLSGGLGEGGGGRFQQSSTIRVMDGDGSIEIQTSDGVKSVTVRDRSNNQMWSGPWNTADQIAAAPAGIRERVQKIQMAGGGLPFHSSGRKGVAPNVLEN